MTPYHKTGDIGEIGSIGQKQELLPLAPMSRRVIEVDFQLSMGHLGLRVTNGH